MAITLLEMLLESGLLTPGQCDEALQNRVFFGGRIGTNLIELGFVGEEDLARFLSRKLAVPYVDPNELLNLPPEIIGLLPKDLALLYQVVPLRLENRRLHVATADPSALTAIDEIAFITGYLVKPLITPEVRLIQALGKYYRYEIDDRYQRIIDQVEERRQSEPPAVPIVEELNRMQEPPAPEPPAEPANEPDETPWLERIERYSIDRISKALAYAEDRKEIADILMRYMAQEFERAALFLLKGETASGWRAVKRGEALKGFKEVKVPLSPSSILRTVAEGKEPYFGLLPQTSPNDRMSEGLGGGVSGEILLVPLPVGGRTVIVLYAEDAGGKLQKKIAELQKLAGKAALAFEILIAREKILMG